MKLAIATQHLQRIGGVETYLSDIIPALRQAGHEVAVLSAGGAGEGKDTIFQAPPDYPVWVAGEMGAAQAVDALRAWRPDVVYAHGMEDPALEAAVMSVAPSVFFLHVYHGTCISGAKRFARPVLRPCDRTFGLGCLLQYYPRRCGGVNPVTMVDLYLKQRKRLLTLRRCDAVVTHSLHMYNECVRHGIDENRLHQIVFFSSGEASQTNPKSNPLAIVEEAALRCWSADRPARLLFVGRLDANKGVHLLLQAAVKLPAMLGRKIVVTIAGDGPERRAIEYQIESIRAEASASGVSFKLAGWLNREAVRECMEACDLVVFPSVWPEPFGLVGPEAGRMGIPVAAFNVGGVPSWLVDGVNGVLAPGDPPTADGLAVAIAACLRDEATYRRLSRGAVEMSARFSRSNHLRELERVLEQVAASPKTSER